LDKHEFLALPLTTAATYAMAALSWNLLEKPFLKLKRYFDEKLVHVEAAGVLPLSYPWKKQLAASPVDCKSQTSCDFKT